MTLGELAEVAQQTIVCMDGLNGKIIFKEYRNVPEKNRNYERFKKYKDVDVLSVWSEIVAEKPLGFCNIAKPVLKCYLNHCALREILAKENEHENSIKILSNRMQ